MKQKDKMKTYVAAMVCGLALLVVGCSSTSKPYDGPDPATTVELHFHSFDPASVTINTGQTVRWKNTSIIWHTVTCDPAAAKEESHVALPAGAEVFDSGKVPSNGNYWHTFTKPGIYHYICKPHEESGMAGTVVVLQPK
jgi:plastocyanin